VVYQGGASPTQPPAPTATPTQPAPTPVPVGPVPSNDSINNPVVINYPGGAVTYSQTLDTTGATSEATDPTLPLTTRTKGANTVWYSFTPAYKGKLAVKTTGSTYDTISGIWTRTSTGALKIVKVSDSYNGSKQTYASISVSSGVTYLIEVASKKQGGGSLVFNLSYTPNVPSNNRLSSAASITYAGKNKVTAYKNSMDVNRATVTTDEPVVPDGRGRGYRTVWYKFKPTQNGTLAVQTSGSNYNTVLTIYRYSGGKWVAMGMNDDWNGPQSGFQVTAKANTSYLIGVVSSEAEGASKLMFTLNYTPE